LLGISFICKNDFNQDKFSEEVIKILLENILWLNEPSNKIKFLLEKYGNNINIPKINCVCPHDDEAIFNLFNGYNPLIYYKKIEIENNDVNDSDVSDDESNGEEISKKVECKICNTKFGRHSDFIRHLSKQHNYNDTYIKNKNTKIYQAFEIICESLKKKSYDLNKFKDFSNPVFPLRTLVNDEQLKKEIIHIAYRWRSSNSILKNIDKPILNKDLIDIWLFCVEHFFWKANHFCWNLNQYGANEFITLKLNEIIPRFKSFEWVRYQILSNMATVQNFNSTELKEIFRKSKDNSHKNQEPPVLNKNKRREERINDDLFDG
jgi:uncharacterized C2H2 Zn-finger protein